VIQISPVISTIAGAETSPKTCIILLDTWLE
jgi:hypothetical protein